MHNLLLLDVSGSPDWTWLTQGGSIGILAAVVIGFVRGWIVPGSHYREVCEQRDKAQELVFQLAESAQRSIETVERRILP